MKRTLILAAAGIALAAPSFAEAPSGPAEIVARHAAETGEEHIVRFIEQRGFDGGYTVFGDSSDRISALEVALRHAEESDDHQRAAFLRAQLAECGPAAAARPPLSTERVVPDGTGRSPYAAGNRGDHALRAGLVAHVLDPRCRTCVIVVETGTRCAVWQGKRGAGGVRPGDVQRDGAAPVGPSSRGGPPASLLRSASRASAPPGRRAHRSP